MLTYFVPYAVSTYGAVSYRLSRAAPARSVPATAAVSPQAKMDMMGDESAATVRRQHDVPSRHCGVRDEISGSPFARITDMGRDLLRRKGELLDPHVDDVGAHRPCEKVRAGARRPGRSIAWAWRAALF